MKIKIRLSAITRLAIGLVLLSVSVLLLATLVGVMPDHRKSVLEGRADLCEAIAITLSRMAVNGDEESVQASLEQIVERNPEIRSAALRRYDGRLLAEVGEHAGNWKNRSDKSSSTEIIVPVMSGESKWSTVELRFEPILPPGARGWFAHPFTRLIVFSVPMCLFLFSLYLHKMLRYLDPSKVVPNRVRTTLDTLAEGLLVLDTEGRIVHANKAFLDTVSSTQDALMGRSASEFSWETTSGTDVYPWAAAIREGRRQEGEMLVLKGDRSNRTFKVNSSPILGDDGQFRGALASFDDVTLIHQKQEELRKMLAQLEKSRKEIHDQNQQLTVLATLDPLTSCLNRRSFFEKYELYWKLATQQGEDFSCLMLDIDHFKKINDNHGHAVGDDVLRDVSAKLRSISREGDLVCRFGGEEFCILLSGLDIDRSYQVGERYRQSVESLEFENLSVTASIGVSCSRSGAADSHELIDQADKALYEAKRGGRNRVFRWDDVPDHVRHGESAPEAPPAIKPGPTTAREGSRTDARPSVAEGVESSIPIPAVNALVSALGYRDSATADHCRRVADLCVALARGVISLRDAYILETAALLHDIGKIGVPDAILMKTEPLSPEDWETLNVHDRLGTDIIESTFANPKLIEIVRTRHAWFGGNTLQKNMPVGADIPVGARILAICDAYDSMVSDRVYRKGMSPEEAMAELRRCAVRQFDPELVERFVELMESLEGENGPDISKAAALGFGTQIERLAEALDRQDVASLAAHASRLNQTARQHGVEAIAEAADNLQGAAVSECDIEILIGLTRELLNLCRCVQRSCLEQNWPGETEAAAEDWSIELSGES